MKKGALYCAMSEMPFGEGMRGKSVCLLMSEEWGGVSVVMVFSDRRWRTCVKCLIDSGCLLGLMATRVKPSIGGIGLS